MYDFKWFYRVNLVDNSLMELTLLPGTVGSCSDLLSHSEIEISNLNWAGVNEGYLTYQTALSIGITEEQIKAVKNLNNQTAIEINQSHTSLLYDFANHEDINSVWDSFSGTEKEEILSYRQALQVIEHNDIFSPVWPSVPLPIVNFYKNK